MVLMFMRIDHQYHIDEGSCSTFRNDQVYYTAHRKTLHYSDIQKVIFHSKIHLMNDISNKNFNKYKISYVTNRRPPWKNKVSEEEGDYRFLLFALDIFYFRHFMDSWQSFILALKRCLWLGGNGFSPKDGFSPLSVKNTSKV